MLLRLSVSIVITLLMLTVLNDHNPITQLGSGSFLILFPPFQTHSGWRREKNSFQGHGVLSQSVERAGSGTTSARFATDSSRIHSRELCTHAHIGPFPPFLPVWDVTSMALAHEIRSWALWPFLRLSLPLSVARSKWHFTEFASRT